MQNLQNTSLLQIYSSFSFSVLHLINKSVKKSKVPKVPHSISWTCLAQEFGLVFLPWKGTACFVHAFKLNLKVRKMYCNVIENKKDRLVIWSALFLLSNLKSESLYHRIGKPFDTARYCFWKSAAAVHFGKVLKLIING